MSVEGRKWSDSGVGGSSCATLSYKGTSPSTPFLPHESGSVSPLTLIPTIFFILTTKTHSKEVRLKCWMPFYALC